VTHQQPTKSGNAASGGFSTPSEDVLHELREHTEVGGRFIHFNFTPRGQSGDKATPSLIGDVARGVFLSSGEFFGLKSWGSANITVETQAAPDQRWHKSQMVLRIGASWVKRSSTAPRYPTQWPERENEVLKEQDN